MQSTNYEFECSSQRDKSFWVSTYASLGSSYLLLSFLVFLMFLTLWKNQEDQKAKSAIVSHLTFVISLFIKSIGFCAAGIVLRYDNFKWDIVSPILTNLPQSLIVLSVSLFIMRWSISEARHVNHPLGNKISKLLTFVPIASVIFFVVNLFLSITFYFSKSDIINQANTWISFGGDILISIALIACIYLIKANKNVIIDSTSPTIKNIHILSMLILISLILRGVCYPINYYAFTNPNGNDECKVPSLMFFIFQSFGLEVIPTFMIIALEGIMEKVLSYNPIA